MHGNPRGTLQARELITLFIKCIMQAMRGSGVVCLCLDILLIMPHTVAGHVHPRELINNRISVKWAGEKSDENVRAPASAVAPAAAASHIASFIQLGGC